MLNSNESKNNADLEVEAPIDAFRMLLDGVLETCSDEMIKLYVVLILNPTLDDSFKIEEMRRNRRRVQLRLNKKLQFDEIVNRQKKVPDLCGSSVLFSQTRLPNTIRVSELANNCSKELLNLYFSNPKVSQGGEIKSIKMFSYENKALITFKNYTKCDDVMSQSHIVCENTVKLEKYYGPIEDEYFREEDEIESSQMLLDSSVSSSSSKFKQKSLASYPQLKSFTSQMPAIDKTKLVISNIQENISLQQLDFYIQLITNRGDINEINWSLEHKGKLIIDFKKEMDINRILQEYKENNLNNLNGKPVQIETVNVTRTFVVLVKGLKSNHKSIANLTKLDSKQDEEEYHPEMIPATRDLLDLYFVNKIRSGGGEVEKIERKSSRYWLVVMKDQRSIKEILSNI